MAAKFIFISLFLVCMKGDCHLCFVDECQWFGQINLWSSREPQKIAGTELTSWSSTDMNYNFASFSKAWNTAFG